MNNRLKSLILIMFGLLFLTACGGDESQDTTSFELPTLVPTIAELLPVTQTPLPTEDPAAGLPPTFTPPPPQATFTPIPPPATVDPSQPIPTETPDFSIMPEINLTTGVRNPFLMGEVIELSGRAKLRSDQTMEAALVTLDGRVLAGQQLELGQFNTWQAELTIPNKVSGQALILVGIANPDGTMAALESLDVFIEAVTEGETRYLTLDQPDGSATASAGYYFYFSGRAALPIRNLVNLEIRTNNCRETVSKHSLVLSGSGAWEGFIQVPTNVTDDEVCTVAFFGEPNSSERREFQWMVPVRPYQDKNPAVVIGSPAAGSDVQAGQTLSIYGTSAHAPNDEVRISLQSAGGNVIATAVATADVIGYWETDVLLPVGATGEIQITATVGADGQDEAVHTILVQIPVEEEE